MIEEIAKLVFSGLITPILPELWKGYREKRKRKLEEAELDLPTLDLTNTIDATTRSVVPPTGESVASKLQWPSRLYTVSLALLRLLFTLVFAGGIWGVAVLTDNLHEFLAATSGVATWLLLSRWGFSASSSKSPPILIAKVVAAILVIIGFLWIVYLAVNDIVASNVSF